MKWTARKLVYKAKSPIHVGCYTLGYIKLTRPYITGKAMWGAATANLTRAFGKEGTDDYRLFGDVLKKDIIFSYFYPALDETAPLLPYYTKNGIKYGKEKMTEDKFNNLFIGSSFQTAILPSSNSAEDETLHESEFIKPRIKNNDVEDVLFVGYVFMKNTAAKEGQPIIWTDGGINLKDAIKTIFIGGDIKYGWGKLELEPNDIEVDEIFGHKFYDDNDSSGNLPIIEIKDDEPIPAHLAISKGNEKLKGDIEPFVGREWEGSPKSRNSGAGQKISPGQMCWVPGSIFMGKDLNLKLDTYGILST